MKASLCRATVEGFSAELAKRKLIRDILRSLVDLQTESNRFIDHDNANEAKPFRWTADPDKIIAAAIHGH
jgi:hypothetical protein